MLDELVTTPDRRMLRLIWTDAAETALPADYLRQAARDAWSLRERLDTGGIAAAPDLEITALQEVGDYGVNVHFSDGHERAIYPYSYLRELSDGFGK
ncbi:DUF971 domain-containing protein [Poseidonocella sp. HB161398]|uniref:gamma-butyrobetaine hydroxylase-like domain-containing protein n=1 Tax=Poseidonocella sp. HB161398 TaxID=2320855 RepID=UPI001486D37D|nr:DUF971 domain-containing protein [Poseidonocella sp. HB161398]